MSKSFTRTIPHNKVTRTPSNLITFDVESHVIDRDNGTSDFIPFLWCSYAIKFKEGDIIKSTYAWGSEAVKFWDWVESNLYSKTRTYLTSHHLEVDFMPMNGLIELRERGWNLDKIISHGRVLTLYYSKGDKTLIILNNGNLFDGSIDAWGKVLKVPKLEMPGEEEPIEKWEEYCRTDAYIVVRMWQSYLQFIHLHDLGNFAISKSGQAMHAYRHRFMSRQISLHNDPGAMTLERNAYHGGRFEALQLGEHPQSRYYQVDMNSMYGYIMAKCPLPYELRGYESHVSIDRLRKLVNRYAVITHVLVDTPEPFIIHKVENKITYAPGRFECYLCTPEIKYALGKGYIKEIYETSWYYQDTVLSDYATYFINLKKRYTRDNNLPMRQLTKLFLNSLYGKFGQHGYDEQVIGTCDPKEFRFLNGYDVDKKVHYELAYYNGQIHRTDILPASDKSYVPIAAHVTAYGRMMLYNYMCLAGIENVYHVATDSLITNQVGYERLRNYLDEIEEGKMKLEREYTTLTIYDVNDMLIDGKVKCKGIPKKATYLGGSTWEVTCWPKFLSMLKKGELSKYYVRKIQKTLKRIRYNQMQTLKTVDQS